MKTSSEYYLQQYGVEALVQPQQFQGPVYDTSTLDYENSVGGEFGFGNDNPTYALVDGTQNSLAALQSGAQGAGVNDQESLRELDGMVGASAPQADPLSLLQEIKDELKKPEVKSVLAEETIILFQNKISRLSEAARKPDADTGDLVHDIEELKENLASAIEDAATSHGEQVASLGANVGTLLNKVERSKLDSETKDDFKERLEDIQGDLKKEKVDVEKYRERLTELNKEIAREIKVEDLTHQLETLPSKIPSEGSHNEQTMELATLLTEAVRSDDWSAVRDFLTDKRDNHKNQGNNFIPQLIGTIFMDLAGSDEDKLDQFLALIPSEVRDLMAETATQEDVNSTEGLNDPAKYQYYGRPSATADRLHGSRIDGALDQDVEPLPG